jgi:glutamate racemase
MSDTRPIGVFDSGLGGLTVVREIFRMMPAERVLYLGDTARCPYGNRSDDTIRQFGAQDASFLISKDIKMLVVACNTVSSVALDHIRSAVSEDIPVIGVVSPGARAAVLRTAEKKVGVVGTNATIRTQSYVKAINTLDPAIKVYGKPCPLFVPLVEEGMTDIDITRLVAQHYIYELVDLGIDCLILGCTHYPLLMEVIQETAGSRIQLIDSALWAAREAYDILIGLDALAPKGTDGPGQSTFFVTDVTPQFKNQANRFLGREISNVEQITLEELTQNSVSAGK